MRERMMMDRAMERPINFDDRPVVRRRINPIPLDPRGPRTPVKSDRRAYMDD